MSIWRSVNLSKLCTIKPPKKEAKEKLTESDLVSFVPMNDLGVNSRYFRSKDNRPLKDVYGAYTYFANHDVLLAKITPCFENGKLGIACNLTNGIGFGSSEYVVLRSKGGLVPEYLYYYLSQDLILEAGAKVMTGAVGHKRVPNEYIENLCLPLPPLPEQKRIVAILDEAFAGISQAIANTEKNLANARELFESYLNDVFTTKGEGWIEKRLGNACSIKHGFAFKSEYFSNDGDHVLLTPGSFHETGGFRDQGIKTKYYIGEVPDGYILNEGDFLIAMTEQAVGLLGSSLIVPESNRYLHNQRLGLVQTADDMAWDNEFFHHQFNTIRFRNAIQSTASGVKVRHTSPSKLGEIPIFFPKELSEQKKLAYSLNELKAHTQLLESIYKQKLSALSELKQSILQKAFTGDLTQDLPL